MARRSCGQPRARCGGSLSEAAAAAEIVLEIARSSPRRSESARPPRGAPPTTASAPSGSATGCLRRWLPSPHRRTLAPPLLPAPGSSHPGSSTPPSHCRHPPPRAAPPLKTTGAARAVPPRDRLRSLQQCRVASTSAEPHADLPAACCRLAGNCASEWSTGGTAHWNQTGGTLIDERENTLIGTKEGGKLKAQGTKLKCILLKCGVSGYARQPRFVERGCSVSCDLCLVKVLYFPSRVLLRPSCVVRVGVGAMPMGW